MKWNVRLALTVGALAPVVGLAACSSGDSGGPQQQQAQGPAKRLEGETGTRWSVDVDPTTQTPDTIVAIDPIAPSAVNGVSYEQAARDFLDKHKDMWRLASVPNELALEDVILSGDHTAHVRFVQVEGGLRVDGRFLAVHFRADGSIGGVNGVIAPDAAKAVGSPTLGADQAAAAAESAIAADFPGYQRAWLDAPPATALLLVPNGSGATLAYRVTLAATSLQNGAPEAFDRIVHVDATSGAILEQWDTVESITGSGTGVLGDKKSVEVSRRFLFWRGFELVKAGSWFGGATQITTYDYNGGALAVVVSPDKNSWEDGVTVGKGSAIDGHRYITDSEAYYRKYHGWASYDGNGSSIRVIVHENTAQNRDNAYWDGRDAMHFSDGDTYTGGKVGPLAAGLDVTGHEFTHGVTQSTSGLKYAAQSGALNESISDIFGTFIEDVNSAPFHNLQILADASFPGGLRDFAHPTAHGQPDNMANLAWKGATPARENDWGGVHGNSGIPNNAWWLMTFGGTNDTSKIPVTKTLGITASRALWWGSNRYLFDSGTQFDQAARWQTMYGYLTGKPVEAVGCAWVATGVITSKYVKDTYDVQCYCEADDGGVQQPADMKCCEPGKSDQCCKACDDAGADGGAPSSPNGDPAQPDLFDSCRGRGDGVYCSQLASYSAIVCRNGSIVSGQQCANSAKCLGPNGPGTQVQCEGQAPPPPAADAGAPPPPTDGCAGRPDGIYCSVATPFSAYVCKGGSIAGGQQCASGTTCTGPNGPGDAVQCR